MDRTFRAVAETVTDAVVSADRYGLITYINKGAERLFGWAPADLVGQPLTVLMPERFRAVTPRSFLRHASSEDTAGSTVLELTALHQDGREFPVELSLARWDDPTGRFFTAIIRDATERQRRDEERRAMTAQLELTNQELETFSYSVSHDLRAPVRSIDGFSSILEEDYGGRLDDRGREYLQRIRANTQRMYTLIDALLGLSRVTQEEMRSEVLDLSALAQSVATELQRGEPSRRVEFIIPPGLTAIGDPSLLRVLLENLIGNAWKFTARVPHATIEFGTTDVLETAAYFVRDNGAGFDMAYADKLFGAFQRLHTAREFPGTGIGLATVQRIARRHGGGVWAEGELDRGATFYFTLAGRAPAGARHPSVTELRVESPEVLLRPDNTSARATR
jgi:PAS domain S-box-containing protein